MATCSIQLAGFPLPFGTIGPRAMHPWFNPLFEDCSYYLRGRYVIAAVSRPSRCSLGDPKSLDP
jgi:hypothetical protein